MAESSPFEKSPNDQSQAADDLESALDRLKQAKLGMPEEEDLQKFKRMILTFKRKYQQALQDLAAKEKSQAKESAELTKKVQEALEENTALILQQKTLRQYVQEARTEAKSQRQEYEDLYRKSNRAQEALKILEEESKQFKAQLGSQQKIERDSDSYKEELTTHKNRIAALENEKRQLLDAEREIREKMWLVKEELNRTKDALADAKLNWGTAEERKKLEELQQHASQLERAVEHLRSKSEEAELNADSLQKDFTKSLEHIEIQKEEIVQFGIREEQQRKELQHAQGLNMELENELHVVKSQLMQIKDGYGAQLELLRGKESLLEATEKQLELITKERKTFENKTAELLQIKQVLEQELESMKQTLVQGLKETKEIKHYYQTLANEKTAALQKSNQMQVHIQELKEELKRREKELEEAQIKFVGAKKEAAEVEQRNQNIHKTLREKEESLASVSEQLRTLQTKIRKAEDTCRTKDEDILEAQQHMAKKVKETARLTETLEEKQRLITKLQEDFLQAKSKSTEANANLESHLEQQKKLQSQLASLEEKYFKVHERLQETEAQNKELKKVEEKHQQMQQLLSNLGTVIGSPVGFTQPHGVLPEPPKHPSPTIETPKPKRKPEPPPQKPRADQPNLFDQPHPNSKFKKDFFEE